MSPSSTTDPSSEPARRFQTLSLQGLDRDAFPLRLWEKAKRDGVWNPSEIDLGRDREDWLGLAPEERDLLLRLTALFQAGEESVARDLLPLIAVMADEGRLEEEMYLTSFLWEEAKHVDAFRRFLDEVVVDLEGEGGTDLDRYGSPSYRSIFEEMLPRALGRLRTDPSPIAQAEASVTYHMVVEGVLAETGYHGYGKILEARDLLPGMCRVVRHLQGDESRHMAYGVYLLCRLVAEHGEPVWQAIEARMGALLPLALGVIEELFAPYDPIPFGLDPGTFAEFAVTQFQHRVRRIETARSRGMAAAFSEPGLRADPEP